MLFLLFVLMLYTSIGSSNAHKNRELISNLTIQNILAEDELNLSFSCRQSLQQVQSSSSESATIIRRSFDHRPPDPQTETEFADFGEYDKCLQIQENEFSGKYCLYRQHFDYNHESGKRLAFYLRQFFKLETMAGSVCLPSSCSDEEAEDIIQQFLVLNGTKAEIRNGCQTKDRLMDPAVAQEELPFQQMLMAWIVFVLTATVVSLKSDSQLIRCFSLLENGRRVFKSSKPSCYDFLFGFRYYFFITASWLHIFHLFLFWSPLALINILSYRTNLWPGIRMMFSNFSHSMGANILWSAILSFNPRLQELRQDGEFHATRGLVSRVLRTLPLTYACYLLTLSFPRSWVWGPIFRESFDAIRNNCLSRPWNDLSFNQNETPADEICIGPSWIIAPDMQFFAASYVLIFLYHKKPMVAKVLLWILLMVSCLVHAMYLHVNEYPPYFRTDDYDFAYKKANISLHVSSVNYVSSYIVGLLAAIYFKERPVVSSFWLKSILAVTPVACFWLSWFVTYTWTLRKVTRTEELVYGALYRPLIAFAFAIGFYNQSSFLQNFFITRIMSHRLFVVLGRFNYSIYMAHYLFIYYHIFATRSPIHFTGWDFLWRGSLVSNAGIVIGFFLHLFFEAPFCRLSDWISLSDRKGNSRGKKVHSS